MKQESIALDTKTEEQEQIELESARTKKPWIWILLAGLVLGTGALLMRQFTSANTQKPATAQVAPPPPPRAVETTTLMTGQGMRRVQLLGQVEATQQATIRAQTGGVIEQVMVQPGDKVARGMTIAILDDADQQLALSQAVAQLAQQRSNLARLEVGTRKEIIAQRRATVRSAQAREKEARDNLRRNNDLVKQGAISQRLLVEAQTAVDDSQGARLAAEATLAEAQAGATSEEMDAQRANVAASIAAVKQAKLAIQRTRIAATSPGVVQERRVSPGDFVQSGGEIASLVAGDRLDVFLELPEELTGKVTPGTQVELTARALPQWRANAAITGVVPAANGASRRQRVRVQMSNPPQGLLSGMAITGNLQIAANTPSLIVSRDALTKRQNQWFVYTIANGKARQIKVQMIADMGEKVAISNPELRAGQAIVSRGGDGLSDGTAIKLVNQ